MSDNAAIRFDAAGKSFASENGPVAALEGLSFEVPQGAFVTLLGPSGCGKTTALRLADGLIAPDTGSVSVFGAPPRPGPDVGMVFQSFRLLPWASAQANIEFALRSLNLPRKERIERAQRWLDLVGLSRFAGHYPGQLSGGMRQRVALARAFACAPQLLLMDEPFASLDAQTRELMQGELLSLWAQHHATVLFVTHSVDEAIVLSDRILLMGPRPGRIVEEFDVPLERPRRIFEDRDDTRFRALRATLAQKMRALVLSDPQSDFYGRA